jgi:hypothetical protein
MRTACLATGMCRPRVLAAFGLFCIGASLAVVGLASPLTKSTGGLPSSGTATSENSGWSWIRSAYDDYTPTYFADMTCVSGDDCWAVGGRWDNAESRIRTLVEHWDGVSWSLMTPADPGTAHTYWAVTCVSATDCWAVGDYRNGVFAPLNTLIGHWDGTSWNLVPSPTPSTHQSSLYDVACISSDNCWAVGTNAAANQFYEPLLEKWDGSSWQVVNVPNLISNTDYFLSGVACTSESLCWAIGESSTCAGACLNESLILRWDGTNWTVSPSPNTTIGTTSYLTDIICTTASDCWAVGGAQDATTGKYRTLIERWDGSLWTDVPSPNTSDTEDNKLSSVTCTTASECWAVGKHRDAASGNYRTLTERWDGFILVYHQLAA